MRVYRSNGRERIDNGRESGPDRSRRELQTGSDQSRPTALDRTGPEPDCKVGRDRIWSRPVWNGPVNSQTLYESIMRSRLPEYSKTLTGACTECALRILGEVNYARCELAQFTISARVHGHECVYRPQISWSFTVASTF